LCGGGGFALPDHLVDVGLDAIQVARGYGYDGARVLFPDFGYPIRYFADRAVGCYPYDDFVAIDGGYGYGVAHAIEVGFGGYVPLRIFG
jgi:hypothetical protein